MESALKSVLPVGRSGGQGGLVARGVTVLVFVVVGCVVAQAGVAPVRVVAGEPFEDRSSGDDPVGVSAVVDEFSFRHGRPARSGAVRAGVVVRLGRRRRIRDVWWALTSRSTRLWFTSRPPARSCAVTLGGPIGAARAGMHAADRPRRSASASFTLAGSRGVPGAPVKNAWRLTRAASQHSVVGNPSAFPSATHR